MPAGYQPGQALSYKFGSLTHTDPAIRRQAIEHNLACIDAGKALGSKALTVWIADGANFPGQQDLSAAFDRYLDSLAVIYDSLPEAWQVFLEHKFYEPACYHTDIADWGMAYNLCMKLGPNAKVLVDLGHHAQGTNIEHIVAILLDEDRLGGFHFNDAKYGDDDLMVGSIDPYQMFRITHELINAMRDDDDPVAQKTAEDTVYMLDQCHNIEPKVPAIIRSVQSRTLPSLPVPVTGLTPQDESSQLIKLMEAMITCLESHRRDELDSSRSKQLHRFIKRMRKAGYDLKDIL